MPRQLFILGYPHDVGGAGTELWHTLKLWRRMRWRLTLIPTWQADPRWQRRLSAIGCTTHHATPATLHTVPGLTGATVFSMCNARFLEVAPRLRMLGCRLIWAGCMNWLFPAERQFYGRHGPFDRHVFQSRFQRDRLLPQLRRFGYRDEQGAVIRGAFDAAEFPFQPRPHRPDEALVIGRISRAAPEKFHRQTWRIYGRTPYPVVARVLGWSAAVRREVGPPPRWAEVWPAGTREPRELLGELHALVHAGGRATENWPRIGLEAMAAGVPLVVDDRGGWSEMIHHGRTGFLCQSADDFAFYTALLARDERRRQRVVRAARESLGRDLAPPRQIAAKWQRLLSGRVY